MVGLKLLSQQDCRSKESEKEMPVKHASKLCSATETNKSFSESRDFSDASDLTAFRILLLKGQ